MGSTSPPPADRVQAAGVQPVKVTAPEAAPAPQASQPQQAPDHHDDKQQGTKLTRRMVPDSKPLPQKALAQRTSQPQKLSAAVAEKWQPPGMPPQDEPPAGGMPPGGRPENDNGVLTVRLLPPPPREESRSVFQAGDLLGPVTPIIRKYIFTKQDYESYADVLNRDAIKNGMGKTAAHPLNLRMADDSYGNEGGTNAKEKASGKDADQAAARKEPIPTKLDLDKLGSGKEKPSRIIQRTEAVSSLVTAADINHLAQLFKTDQLAPGTTEQFRLQMAKLPPLTGRLAWDYVEQDGKSFYVHIGDGKDGEVLSATLDGEPVAVKFMRITGVDDVENNEIPYEYEGLGEYGFAYKGLTEAEKLYIVNQIKVGAKFKGMVLLEGPPPRLGIVMRRGYGNITDGSVSKADIQSWLREFRQCDKWIFCLTAARILVANQERK